MPDLDRPASGAKLEKRRQAYRVAVEYDGRDKKGHGRWRWCNLGHGVAPFMVFAHLVSSSRSDSSAMRRRCYGVLRRFLLSFFALEDRFALVGQLVVSGASLGEDRKSVG